MDLGVAVLKHSIKIQIAQIWFESTQKGSELSKYLQGYLSSLYK